HLGKGHVGGEGAAARDQRPVLETAHRTSDEAHVRPCSAVIVLHSSCPGLTRASIEKKRFNRSGWIAGSSPAMTAAGSVLMTMLVAARIGCAQRGADALRRRRKLVDRAAERGEGIVDGIDDRRRRADGAALAQPLRLGDGRWRQRLEMMDFDRWDFP